jgi:uncharacterized phiE125 gp8 family phage protein
MPAEQASFSHFSVPDQFDTASPPNLTADYSTALGFISAARIMVEKMLNRACITQHWRLLLRNFPLMNYAAYDPTLSFQFGSEVVSQLHADVHNGEHHRWIVLGHDPVQSIDSIKYIDTDGNQQTLSTDVYQLDSTCPSRILLKANQSWPSTMDIENAVTVEYAAGFGDSAAMVPEPIKLAIKFLAGHWYDNRLPVGSTPSQEVLFTMRTLLSGYKIYSFPK